MSDHKAKPVVGARAFKRTAVLLRIAAGIGVALLAGLATDRWIASDLAGEQRVLEGRAFELVTRAMAPGSALACLDASVSSAIEEGCEKALFATPESTAIAVSYVAAQLSLLASGKNYIQRAGVDYGPSLIQLRRNAEWDAFGIVAHVLAVRDGCTATQCQALAALNSPQRVRANLARRTFDANVTQYAAAWSATRERSELARHVEPAEPADQSATSARPAPAAAPRTPNKYFFPSADSIPAVSIMSAEPPEPPAPSKDKAVAAEASRKLPARTTASVNTNAGSGSNPARGPAPMPLAPAGP